MTVLSKKNPKPKPEVGEPSLSANGDGSVRSHSQINALDEQKWPAENIENGLCLLQSKRRIYCPHKNTRSSKGRDRENRSPPNSAVTCQYNTTVSDQYSTSICGYNSEDEYGEDSTKLNHMEWVEKDRVFEKKLKKCGFILKQMKEDGACLFRAVSDQIFGDQDMHDIVRKQCMDYIFSNKDFYMQYVTEDFNTYIARKRLERTHGNHIEIHAMSELYSRPIEVYCYRVEPINIFHGGNTSESSSNPPIKLSYQRGSHYNSIVDPHKATIGIGLGLPNFSPGSADKKLLNDAVMQSEDLMLEQAMLEDKLKATDWKATSDTIDEQIARESYLQFLKDNKRRNEKEKEPLPTSTVTSESVLLHKSCSPPPRNSMKSKTSPKSSSHQDYLDTENSFPVLSPLVGLSMWDDIDILTRVLAVSQQEYLQNLKKQHDEHKEETDKKYVCDVNKPSTSQ